MVTIAAVELILLTVVPLILRLSVRTAHRALRCPISGTDVKVKFLQALPEGRPMEVTACSAFKSPTDVVCNQRCLGLLARSKPLEEGCHTRQAAKRS